MSYRWRVIGAPIEGPQPAEPADQGYLTHYHQYGPRSDAWVLTLPTGGGRILDGPADVEWLNAQSLHLEEYA